MGSGERMRRSARGEKEEAAAFSVSLECLHLLAVAAES